MRIAPFGSGILANLASMKQMMGAMVALGAFEFSSM